MIMDHVYTSNAKMPTDVLYNLLRLILSFVDYNLYDSINIKTPTEYEFEDEFNH
jgi:hypothetical protein